MSEETKNEIQGTDPVKEEIKTPVVKEEKKAPANTKAPVATPKANTAASKEKKETKPEPETKTTPVTESNKAATTKSEPDFMDHYRKAYPKEKCFHVTSDKQVFLSCDLSLAKRHQKTVDETKDVKTIER